MKIPTQEKVNPTDQKGPKNGLNAIDVSAH
jgi:hypothetical protein